MTTQELDQLLTEHSVVCVEHNGPTLHLSNGYSLSYLHYVSSECECCGYEYTSEVEVYDESQRYLGSVTLS